MRTIKFIIIILVFLIIGCSVNYGKFSVISTKQIDLNNKKLELVASNVTGKDITHIIILIPTGNPNIEKAVRNVLSKYNADVLINASVNYKWFYIPYVYGQYIFEVNGDAYKIKKSIIKEYGLNSETNSNQYTVFFSSE